MASQTPGSNSQAVSGDIAVLQSNRKGWFSRVTNGLSVGNKIKYGYALALSVGVLGTTIGLILGDHYQEKALQEQQNAFKELNLLYRLQTGILQTRTHQQQLIPLVPYPNLYTEEYSHITDIHAPGIEQVWSELQKYTKSADYTGEKHTENIPLLLQTYDDLPQTYIRQLDELFQQLDLSPLSEKKIAIAQQRLLKFTNSELAIEFDGISDELLTVIKVSYEELTAATATFKTAAQMRIYIIAASVLLSVVIATLFALFTSRTITHPVEMLTNMAQRVTKESNFDLQAPVMTTDEIGILAIAFNQTFAIDEVWCRSRAANCLELEKLLSAG